MGSGFDGGYSQSSSLGDSLSPVQYASYFIGYGWGSGGYSGDRGFSSSICVVAVHLEAVRTAAGLGFAHVASGVTLPN
ncbi:MAG: hypothetical protein ACI814_000085 [Mariniblastus sp.]|jgi:hypothetical protein